MTAIPHKVLQPNPLDAVGPQRRKRTAQDPHLEDAQSEFIGKVSHELRTPLTAIQESLDIVLDGLAGPLTERQDEFLTLARRNVSRLGRLVDELLDFTVMWGERPPLNRRRVDLSAVVERVVASATPKAGPRLDLDLSPTSLPVLADVGRLEQALRQLVDNAFFHGAGQPVVVRSKLVGEEALVEVRDFGPSIPKDQLENIFEAFVQLSSGPGRKVGGFGLGLAVAKGVVERHAGRLWAAPHAQGGNSFFIALKLLRE